MRLINNGGWKLTNHSSQLVWCIHSDLHAGSWEIYLLVGGGAGMINIETYDSNHGLEVTASLERFQFKGPELGFFF